MEIDLFIKHRALSVFRVGQSQFALLGDTPQPLHLQSEILVNPILLLWYLKLVCHVRTLPICLPCSLCSFVVYSNTDKITNFNCLPFEEVQ